MPTRPERLAAITIAGAVALSLLLGVVWRDPIACALVEASGLTAIGPNVFADAPADAPESALLLDLARDSRQRADGRGSDDAVVIFSNSNFWRGDTDARVIRAPFRACVVIGPQARGLDRIAGELARVDAERGESRLPEPMPSAPPSSATRPAAATNAAPTAVAGKPGDSQSPANPSAAKSPTAPQVSLPDKPDPAPDSAPLATTKLTASPPAPKQAEPPPATAAPTPSPRETTPAPPSGPSPFPTQAKSPAPEAAPPVSPAPARLVQKPAPARQADARSAAAPSPPPRPAAPRPRPSTPVASASAFHPGSVASAPRAPSGPGQPWRAPALAWSAPLAPRHIRPTQQRSTVATRAPTTPSPAPVASIAPPRAAPPSPARHHPFAEPPLWDKWERGDPLPYAPVSRRMDTFKSLLYQARERGNEAICSTGSTNGYCRCRKASMRRWR